MWRAQCGGFAVALPHVGVKGKCMSIGLVFWIVMLVWLVWGVWQNRANLMAGGSLAIEFILFLLVGWQVFGAPIRG